MEKYLSVSEATNLLVKEGILKGKFTDQAVRRLINLGELKAQKPPANQPKLGYQIERKSLEEYVEIGKMGVSELRKELLKVRRELVELKGEEVEEKELKEVIGEGVLVKQPNDRYEVDGIELSSGYPIEVLHNGKWISSRIEHTNGDYYIYDLGSEQRIEGLTVRVRGR